MHPIIWSDGAGGLFTQDPSGQFQPIPGTDLTDPWRKALYDSAGHPYLVVDGEFVYFASDDPHYGGTGTAHLRPQLAT